MVPTSGLLFVEVVENESQFEVVGGETKYRVAQATDVSSCKVGDYVLFNDSREYQFDGKKIIVVDEEDVVGVCTGK